MHDRHTFHLRSSDERIIMPSTFDPATPMPVGYEQLSADDLPSLGEFMQFLIDKRDAASDVAGRSSFRVRDHDARPVTASTPTAEELSATYAQLDAEERHDVFEFVHFLLGRESL